jgi:hypothetical protein
MDKNPPSSDQRESLTEAQHTFSIAETKVKTIFYSYMWYEWFPYLWLILRQNPGSIALIGRMTDLENIWKEAVLSEPRYHPNIC